MVYDVCLAYRSATVSSHPLLQNVRRMCASSIQGHDSSFFNVVTSKPSGGVCTHSLIREYPRKSAAYKVPYILPSSVCCKSFVCHSYKNCRGVGCFFPFWNRASHEHASPACPVPDRERPQRAEGSLFAARLPRASRGSSPPATSFYFQALTTVAICKPFVFKSIQQWGGVVGGSFFSTFCFLPSAFPCQLSKRFISFCKRNLAPRSICVNSTPRPSPGMVSRTTASARTFPPGTSKASLTFVPTGGGSGVEMNRPPMPSVLTREKSWRSPPYQLTGIPLGSDTRGYRRVGRGGCSATEGKDTSCHQSACERRTAGDN